jgi:magnesium transporter
MLYISEVLGRPILDAQGERLGSVEDVLACGSNETPQPRLVALLAQAELVPIAAVAELSANPIRLRVPRHELTRYTPAPEDIFLARTLLDKQVVDTRHARAVRVNDVELAVGETEAYVARIDCGGAGLLRRLGLSRIAQSLAGRSPESLLAWDQIELVSRGQALPGTPPPPETATTGDRLGDLHPADRAEILSDLAQPEGRHLFAALDAETAADTLEAVEPDFQAHLLETLPDDQAVKIVEKMAPDEAADLLAELPEDRRADLLHQMAPAAARAVRQLLAYAPGTAGSLMTNACVALPQGLTAGQTLTRLRELASESDTLYYVYVVDDQQHLAGVLALSDLVLAQPDTPMTEFTRRRVIAVNVNDSHSEVAQTVSKYHLLAVPVVDDEQHLLGMITAGDALSPLLPAQWKKHRPQRYA